MKNCINKLYYIYILNLFSIKQIIDIKKIILKVYY